MLVTNLVVNGDGFALDSCSVARLDVNDSSVVPNDFEGLVGHVRPELDRHVVDICPTRGELNEPGVEILLEKWPNLIDAPLWEMVGVVHEIHSFTCCCCVWRSGARINNDLKETLPCELSPLRAKLKHALPQ
jgi:hypothetical protein